MRTLATVVVGLFAVTPWVLAAEKAKDPAAPALVQKTCPVSGKPISKDQSIDYEGQKVYFCCGKCPAKFKESPMKYLPALYKQIYPQSAQVTCPVMGDPIDGKTFVEYKGQQIGFCCAMCPPKFQAAPAKYMAKFKAACTEQVHCPVTGKAIDPKVSTEYKGKVVYFASAGAMAEFKADPAKYAENTLPAAGVVARGATADEDLVLCPVCASDGGAAHKRKGLKTVVHEGKVYFLCSDECVKAFNAAPAKYIKALNAATKKYAGA